MNLIGFAVVVPCVCLLAAIVWPSSIANKLVKLTRRTVTNLVGLQLVAATGLFGFLTLPAFSEMRSQLSNWVIAPSFGLSFRLDMVSSLMLLLVSFIGWIICRYSVKYLDGDANQGRYFRWTAFTIGAVSLLVISGNLLMFFGAWVLTSFGLHQLLMHFPERTAARRAAWTKFGISRVGDCFLLAAIVLVYREFGTFQFDELFAAAATASSSSITAIAWCLVLGAVTKSAQFPLHSWLPETMETPTPVSALMHAGIVNAGGYLVIRLSPIIVQAPGALAFVALIGLLTVCFAGIVMLTQNSIKKTLAYSTIAQMGFMMLQCGLGAFSAAMLHIIAHSLYKAHAFLSSGSVLTEDAKTKSGLASAFGGRSQLRTLLAQIACVVVTIAAAGILFGSSLADKSGGLALSTVFVFALTAWAWDVTRMRDFKAAATGFVGFAVLAILYVTAFYSIDFLVGTDVAVPASGMLAVVVSVGVAILFFGIAVIHWLLSSNPGRMLLAPLYVHASNGFYVDAVVRRIWNSVPSISLKA